jgi:hypothetical protein
MVFYDHWNYTMIQLDNATDIKIVALRNDIAVLKDQFYVTNPDYVQMLNVAYNALDDLIDARELDQRMYALGPYAHGPDDGADDCTGNFYWDLK